MNNKTGLTPSNIRKSNKHLLLQSLRSGGKTIPEISKELKLSPTAITNIVSDLFACNILTTQGSKSNGSVGRKASLITLNSSYGLIILIEFASTYEEDYYRILACDINETILAVKKLPPIINDSSNQLTELIISNIDALLTELGHSGPLLNICIAAPGIIDESTGLLITTCLKKYDEEYNLKELLEAKYNVRVHVRGLLSSAAKAELKKGALRQGCHFGILMNLDNGIGMTFIIDNNPFTGAHGFAGEIGFLTSSLIEGYYESLTERATTGLGREISFAAVRGNIARRKFMRDCSYTTDSLLEDYRAGDEIVVQEVVSNAYKVGSFLKNIVLLLDPEIIVISGLATKLDSHYLDILNGCITTTFKEKTKVVFSSLEHPIYLGLLDTAINNVFLSLD